MSFGAMKKIRHRPLPPIHRDIITELYYFRIKELDTDEELMNNYQLGREQEARRGDLHLPVDVGPIAQAHPCPPANAPSRCS